MKTSALKFTFSFLVSAWMASSPLVLAGNTWDGGGGNGSWSNLANWDSDTIPLSPTALTFGGVSQLTNTNDLFSGGTQFNGMNFSAGAGAFVIGGNSITLGGNIANNSTSTQTINLDMATTAVRTVTLTTGGGNVVLGGNISGTGGGITVGVVANSSGTITLSGNNSYTGNTTLGTNVNQTITLVLGNKNALGSGNLITNAGAILQATTDLSGANKIANNVNASLAVTVSGSNSIEVGGNYTLSNAGNRSLANLISGGTLTLNNVTLNTDATAGRVLTLDGTGITIVKGVVSDGGASHILGIGGTATVTLENVNTYTGGTNLSGAGATLIVGNKEALGNGTIRFTANANMAASTDLVGVNKIANDILSTAAAGPTFGGNYSLEIGGKFVTSATGNRFLTNNIGSGKILIMKDIDINTDVSSPRTLTIAGSGDTIISGIIANGNGAQANRITITNTGVTTLSGNNTYTGVTTLSAGMTVFANTSAKTAAMATAAASASVGLGVGGAGYYSSANVDSLFSGNLTGFSMDAASGVGIDTTAGNFTYSTSQNSTRALTKLGSNSLTLTGNSNYGATTVRAGTLVVNGTVGGSGGLTVRNGGTLGGNGTVNKAVIVESGGTLSPGNSPGALSQGATTLNGGGNYNWQVYDATMGQEGIGFDTINLTTGSALTIASTDLSKFNINLWSLSGIAPDVNGNAINFDNTQTYTWTLFATDQTIANFSADKFQINVASINGTSGFSNALGGGLFSVELGDGNTDLVLRFTAVPEPATWLLLAGSLTCVLVMRRRRR